MGSHSAGTGFHVSLGGKATVHCVHDRIKRQVVTEEFAAELLLEATGIIYDSRIHKLHQCACCENLFWVPHSEPVFCNQCSGRPIHAIGGPLPEPKGVVG